MSGTRDIDGQELNDQAAAAVQRAKDLKRRSAQLAGQIADTESEVARVHDLIAENDTTSIGEQAREVAAEARRFAAHERQQETEAERDE
jgi:hypothetical protein